MTLASHASTQIADLLGVDPDFEPETAALNQFGTPRSETLQGFLRRGFPIKSMKWIVPINLRIRIRIFLNKLNTSHGDKPMLNESTKREIQALCAEDVSGLEEFLGVDLSHWKN